MIFAKELVRDDQGATAIEYGLIAALIAVAAIVAMQNLGNSLNGTFSQVSNTLGGGTSSPETQPSPGSPIPA